MDPSGKLTIETPEQIPLEFPLAGVGSRFLAFLVDSIILLVLLGLVLLTVAVLFVTVFQSLQHLGVWALALTFLTVFVLRNGYFVLFEVLWNGQTPGKRLTHLRVISDTGRPITVIDSLARNLMRLIDALPGFYAFGIVSVVLSRHNKRLGDYVAGTVVVHERPFEGEARVSATATVDGSRSHDAQRLSVAEADLIEAFLARREHLDATVRDRTSHSIATRMAHSLGLPSSAAIDAEPFLEALVRERRRADRFR